MVKRNCQVKKIVNLGRPNDLHNDPKIKPDICPNKFWVRSSQRNITQPQSGLNRGQNSTLKKSLDLVK